MFGNPESGAAGKMARCNLRRADYNGRFLKRRAIVRCRLAIFLFSLLASPALYAATAGVGPRPYFDTFEQTFTIEFASSSDARAARLKILPLLNGKEWAVTCRWDDNSLSGGLPMRDEMEKHGAKGTFYLNRPEKRAFGWDADKAPELLIGGNSLGGHGWTHAYAGWLSRHAMFEELARPKLYWESATDTPVCSHAFAYGNGGNSFDPDGSARDVDESLFRAGFYEFAGIRSSEQSVPSSTIIEPADGGGEPEARRASIEQLKADGALQESNPCMTFGIHAWSFSGKEEKAGQSFALAENNPDYWFCNQGEYGAYRVQYVNTEIKTEVSGSLLKVTLLRPALFDLMHNIPLTFEIVGPSAESVKAIDAGTAAVEQSGARFNLYYPVEQQAPQKIGWVANDSNRVAVTELDADSDFPKLPGLLVKEDGRLQLTLHNKESEPLRQVRLTIRLPMAYTNGFQVVPAKDIAAGGTLEYSLPIQPSTQDFRYRGGFGFYVVQVDFVRAGIPGRLYFSCRALDTENDPSYPAHGFLKLGPVPDGEKPDWKQIGAIAAGEKDSYTLSNGTALRFRPNIPDPLTEREIHAAISLYEADALDPETIVLTGITSPQRPGLYLLRSRVESEKRKTAQISEVKKSRIAKIIFLNGKKVFENGKEFAPAALKAGPNSLLIVAETGTGKLPVNPETAAFFFRLSADGERLTNIKYTPVQD